MDETIAALKAEIEAAEKKRSAYLHRFLNGEHNDLIVRDSCVSLDGRIQGLKRPSTCWRSNGRGWKKF